MDSKLKMIVITFASLMVVLVLSVVAGLNLSETAAKKKKAAALAKQAAASEQTAETESGMDHDTVEKYHLNPMRDPYAFLEDDGFFIPEEKEGQEPANSLSLLASSVMRDLRIFVVDQEGSVKSGSAFTVDITAAGRQGETVTLQDDDMDGILYTDRLDAGDYDVSLRAADGYLVPASPIRIKVSDKVSYTVLKDISFLIHTEDEVDAAVEDTAVREAEADADGTEQNVRLQDGVSIFGIDVSKWNKEIDWKKVKDSGVDFAIIRCGYRGSSGGYLIEDPYFEKNIKGAQEAGVRVGVYFFTQATTAAEGVEEASMLLSLCRNEKLAFPLFIDTEGAGGNGRADHLTKDERTTAVRAFCETIEGAGYTAGIYASKNWFEHNLDMQQLSGYSIWLAQYSARATYGGDYDMWQYTSAGRVDGISTLVDFDVSYVDFESSRAKIRAPQDAENADGNAKNGDAKNGDAAADGAAENGDAAAGDGADAAAAGVAEGGML